MVGVNSSSLDSSNPYHLNLILSNRDGIGQWPSWKQIRVSETKNARFKKKNN